MPPLAIECKQLTRRFGAFTAVDHIDLVVKKGELFGLLGPNGAGKTTTISMLATMLSLSDGSARINGIDVAAFPDAVRKNIGIVFQDPSLDFDLTATENLAFHSALYGLKPELREKRIAQVLALVELEKNADQLVKTFSGGMRRRLEIARGLLHHPSVLFLDEPTLGLDPQTRRRLWKHIKRLNQKEKITIILTTHYLEEADFLCNRIAIVDKGKIVALDSPNNLKKQMRGETVIVKSMDNAALRKWSFPDLLGINGVKEEVHFLVRDSSTFLPELFAKAGKEKIAIVWVEVRKPSLEDVFVHLTGHSIREETAGSGEQAKNKMRFMGWGPGRR